MIAVTVTTATKISGKDQDTLESALEKKYGKALQFTFEIDPQVIGGVKLTIGSTQLDGTLKYKLERIKTELLSI